MASQETTAEAPAGPPCDHPKPPGQPMKLESSALAAGQSLLSTFKPLNKICQHLCAFHCYAHDATRQLRAHHFCSHQNEELRQCVLYDSDKPDARLIGVEYIISEGLFEGLPQEEKKYWHSHCYEVTSGQLVSKNIPTPIENIEMAKVAKTYGKTWHFWQVDRGDTLPLGDPQLMMAFTADGQLDPNLLNKRDKDWGISTSDKRRDRAHLKPSSPPSKEADQPWHTNIGTEVVSQATGKAFFPESMPGPLQCGGVAG